MKFAAALGLILGLAPRAARAEGACPDSLPAVDQRLGKAEALLEDLEESVGLPAPSRSPLEECLARFSVDSFLKDLSEGRLPESLAWSLGPKTSALLWRHYRLKAFEAGDPGLCGPLKALPYRRDRFYDTPAPGDGDWSCRSNYYDMAFARSLIAQSPDFASVCRERIANDVPELEPQAGELCALIRERRREPEAVCARFNIHHLRASRHATQIEEFADWAENVCPALLKALAGDESLCPKARHDYSGDKQDDQDCFAYAAFSRAFNAKDLSLCGRRELCRLMMGERGLSKPYAEALRGPLCELLAKALPPAPSPQDRAYETHRRFGEKGGKLMTLLSESHNLLLAADARMADTGPEAAFLLDAREERIARLRERYLKLKGRLPPLSASSGGP